MMEMICWKSPGHHTRFLNAVQASGKVYDGRVDPEYGAAFYVLTADASTWNRVKGYVEQEGILFGDILKNGYWSEGYRILIEWAANLFNPTAANCNPVEIMRLDEDNYRVAVSALHLRRYGMEVHEREAGES